MMSWDYFLAGFDIGALFVVFLALWSMRSLERERDDLKARRDVQDAVIAELMNVRKEPRQ